MLAERGKRGQMTDWEDKERRLIEDDEPSGWTLGKKKKKMMPEKEK